MPSRIRLAILTALTASACHVARGRPSPDANLIAITHATVITGTGAPPLRDVTVLIRGRRIVAVDRDTAIAASATRIDGTGKFVLPGLWDMHVHLVLEGRGALPLYVRSGVTGVRDMGGQFETIRRFRIEIARGNVVGPRILAAGPQLESPTSWTGILQSAAKPESARAQIDRVVVPDVATARRVVDSLAALGVDFIKSRSYASVDVYWEIANRTHRHRLPLAGHAPFELVIDPVAFADSGNESLEHWFYPGNLTGLPDSTYQRIVAAYVRHGTALLPTLGAWRQHRFTYDSLRSMLQRALRDGAAGSRVASSLIEHWNTERAQRRTERNGSPSTAEQLVGWNRVLSEFARDVGRLHAAGVPVLPGSDLPFARFPGEALQDELIYLVRETGLTPQQVIEGATRESVKWLHLEDSLGTVTAGKIADLVILDADPLADIENVRRVYGVVLAGRWMAISAIGN